MPETLASEIKLSFQWLHQETLDLSRVFDRSQLDYHLALANGTGAGEADKIWNDLRTLAAGANEDLILSALPLTLFGDSLSVALVKVRAILLINESTTAGDDLAIGGAPSHEWQGSFAAAGDKLIVPADSCLLLVNRSSGWPVTAGSTDKLRIANGSGHDIDYKIAVLGTSA